MSQSTKKVLYITATLPALTVTFIYKEIFRLREIGVDIDCVSMNTPAVNEVSDESRSLLRETTYLDIVGLAPKFASFIVLAVLRPVRIARCVGIVLSASPMHGIRDYLRLAYHLVEAAYLCRRLDLSEFRQIHAHFVNGPTSIAMFLSELSGIPFSFTMHASMIWLDPIALSNKLERCSFCASISEYNAKYVIKEYGDRFSSKIQIVHCGIDPEIEPIAMSKHYPDQPIRLLGVGQLNPRKGFHILIKACAILRDKGVRFSCTIVGGGEQREELARLVEHFGLGEYVRLTGAVKHEVVAQLIAECDLFVLPCVISEDGWRDGIPVALMEAMFHQRTVVSTQILGIPELIDDQVNGRLVEPNNPKDLANTIKELAGSPERRTDLATQGHKKILAEFNNLKSASVLAGLFSASAT